MIRWIVSIGLCMIMVNAISNGANEPIADNQLGLTAKDCALQFCEDKDGMALWMSLIQQCNAVNASPFGAGASQQSWHANPYFKEMEVQKSGPVCFQDETHKFIITPGVAGMICSMMGLVGLMMGYSIAERWDHKKNTIHYQELATKEND